jgi:hypothetical protein
MVHEDEPLSGLLSNTYSHLIRPIKFIHHLIDDPADINGFFRPERVRL